MPLRSNTRAMKRKRKDPMELLQSLDLTPEQRTAFAELLENPDVDVLREMIELVYNTAIKTQFDAHIAAALHERSSGRRDQHNGTRSRSLNTRAGSVELDIPRARNSNFMPTAIERFKRSERALISVIQQAFIAGVSTRKMGGRPGRNGRREP